MKKEKKKKDKKRIDDIRIIAYFNFLYAFMLFTNLVINKKLEITEIIIFIISIISLIKALNVEEYIEDLERENELLKKTKK